MGMPPVHDDIHPIQRPFEEPLIGLEYQRVRHDAAGIREHPILGDDGETFDMRGTGHWRSTYHRSVSSLVRQAAQSSRICGLVMGTPLPARSIVERSTSQCNNAL